MFPDETLARRLEHTFAGALERFALTCAAMHPELRAGVLAVGGGVAAYAGPNVGVLTSSVGLGFDGAVTAADFEALEAFHRERGGVPIVTVCPFADRSLLDLVQQRGYRLFTPFSILYRPLQAGGAKQADEADALAREHDTVTVEPVTAATANAWGRAVAGGFEGRDDAEQSMYEPVKFQCPDTVCYLARVGGAPAGGAVTTIVDGAAYFWSASTLPSFRRKGVQTALLQAQLDYAAAAGCDLAVLGTEIGSNSQRNAHRGEFQVAYTVLDFVLPDDPDSLRG